MTANSSWTCHLTRNTSAIHLARPYLPSMLHNLNGLYTWLGFSSGMTLVDLARVKSHFEKLFSTLPMASPLHIRPQDVEFD